MAIIEVRDNAHWHELRAQHIGGSDVGALLGVSPYKTLWQLHMEKAGKLATEDLSLNKAVQAGTYLEDGIARWASTTWDMEIEKVHAYHTVDDVPGMGASLDYATQAGAPVEIKWSGRGHGWLYQGDQILEAPEHYLVQVQQQIACVGAEYGWLIALIDNEPRRMFVPRHDGIITAIREGITQFWEDVHNGVEPDPDFRLDGDAIGRLLEQTPYAEVDLTGVDGAVALFDLYKAKAAEAKVADADAGEAKAKLLMLAKTAMEGSNAQTEKAKVACGDHKMSIYKVAANPGTEITEEMVGTVIGQRKGYQGVRIT
jgi:putative phage-type endonuclease